MCFFNIDRIFGLAKNFGGSLSDFTVWMLERSIKTLGIRVRQQNQKALQLINCSMSLAGVESSMLSPALTSHALLSPEERQLQGITDSLIRLSVGIEEPEDLIADIQQAIAAITIPKLT